MCFLYCFNLNYFVYITVLHLVYRKKRRAESRLGSCQRHGMLPSKTETGRQCQAFGTGSPSSHRNDIGKCMGNI